MNSAYRALAAAILLVPAAASAQLLGSRVGAGAAVGAPPIGTTVESTARTATAPIEQAKAPSVEVKAGVSTRVDRGARCYYQPDNYYYDPVYRDGYYYCEQRSGGVAAGAAVEAGKP